MQVVERSPHDLVPYEKNPRKIPARAVEAVKASIQNYGWKQPIVVDANNVVVAGHVRHRAALELECDTVPVVCADDLSEDQIRAYRVADNKVAELTGWNLDLLAGEVYKVSPAGFTDDELEVLRAAAEGGADDSGADEAESPEGAGKSTSGGANADENDEVELGASGGSEFSPVTVQVKTKRLWEARPKLEELARTFD